MRNRVVELKMVKKEDLERNPKNVRRHSKNQRHIFRKIAEEVGFCGAIIAYQNKKTGKHVIIDGHMRVDEYDAEEVPVIVLDVDEKEADFLLATYDRVGSMAAEYEEGIKRLIEELNSSEKYREIIRLIGYDVRQKTNEKNAPQYEIVPEFDEAYDAVIIFCRSELEFSRLATALELPIMQNRKGRVGMTRVISCEEFLKKWEARK